ncbi:MAG: OmpA family protein [Bacteroidaceae bacterium]|nr:OmpA family protein [Bacteroidaceae bacterium]MBQ5705264.1 OmpA family protein [Bacteroidaceae bacterium]
MIRINHILYILVATLLFSCSTDKAIRKGDQFYAINEYIEAAKEYKKAYRKTSAKEKPKRGVIAWKMAECYRKTNNAARAMGSYKNAIRYNYPDSLAHRHLADALLVTGNYKEAIKSYEAFLAIDSEDRLAQVGLQTARQSADWKKNPTKYIVKRADELNGMRSDFCPMYVGSDTTMIVTTSTRKEATGTDISGVTGQKCADLFLTKRNDKGKWQKVELIQGETNSAYEDGACAFTPDGKMMYFTRCVTDDQFPRFAAIYRSPRKDATWGKPEPVKISSDTLSSYAHPAVSPDGEWLYFASDMAGGVGGFDIWRFYIGGNQFKAGILENLGEQINTEGNELFPAFGPGKELYFSSNGYPGMGGLDIFCASQVNDSTYKVNNMMAPVNSNADDFGITFAPELYRGYFSSNRNDARGWDHIYSFYLPETVHMLRGWLYEKDGYELTGGVIHMIGNDGSKSSIGVMNDGSYSVRVTPGVEYVLLGTCKGYLNAMQELKTTDQTGKVEYQRDFELAPIHRPVLIDNIFYEFDKATLTPESTASLDELVTLLENNPNVTIELGSHCDFRGSDKYNEKLSQKRAESVVNYLIEQGIDAERLTAKGYGESSPKTILKKVTEKYPFLKENDVLTEQFINAIQSEEEQEICHQLNRRTEFRVLRTTYKLYE